MPTSVTITYLQMRSPDELRRAPEPAIADRLLRRAEVPCPAFSRFLYTAVGGNWYWRDRPAGLPRSGANTWNARVSKPGC